MNLILVAPRGFCAGVTMAIETLERALQKFGPPIFVFHEIVHNRAVVDDFRKRGVTFVNELDEVPRGANLLLRAHGVSPEVRAEAASRSLTVVDATCPLVRKVHLEAKRFVDQGKQVFLIGHEGHDEVVGTLGVAPGRIQLIESEADAARVEAIDPERTAFVTQTTLSVNETARIVARLRERFARISGPSQNDICYATQNRQDAVRKLLPEVDVVLVVGSQNSSNSRRLVELALDHHVPGHLVDGPDDLQRDWFTGNETVLMSAGASAPERQVQACVSWLRDQFGADVDEVTLDIETAHFPLPVEVRDTAPSVSSPVVELPILTSVPKH